MRSINQPLQNKTAGFPLLQVFAANNVEIVTKTRTEHMSEDDKEQAKV
jgi:hypothetical protein